VALYPIVEILRGNGKGKRVKIRLSSGSNCENEVNRKPPPYVSRGGVEKTYP
jgi:hypothetical protein